MSSIKFIHKKGVFMSNSIIKTILVSAVFATAIYAVPITSMTPNSETSITVTGDGGTGFSFPTFNGGAASFEQVSGDLRIFVRYNTADQWVGLDGNAGSGWTYDSNWGHYWNDGGGFWFHVEQRTTYIKLQSATDPNVNLVYTITYDVAERVGNAITAKETGLTTKTAGDDGNLGVPFPEILIGGSPVRSSDIEKFVYEIRINGVWVALGSQASTFYWADNGYNNMSDKNQYSMWYNDGGGLWFRPVQQNYLFRIGYPSNGIKDGAINNNYLEFSFIGNPNAPRPDPSALGSIQIGSSANSSIPGWNLVWNDEFNGNSLDRNKWNYDTGFCLNDDPGTCGWGNNELEHYTDSENNIFVKDGHLNLKAIYEPKTFQPQNRTATYSSGKVVTRDKYAFKYGRIDFSCKLPAGKGLWPAVWLLPQNSPYGGWAASGEIDVMEAKGRLTGESSGALHFGGEWPGNTYLGNGYSFPDGKRIDTDFHVYSAVWEEGSIKWYVDGNCFFVVKNDQWHSTAAPQNQYAPFDTPFYIIMNLAVGGWFDSGINPNTDILPQNFPVTMLVDYVRVYKEADDNGGGVNMRELQKLKGKNGAAFAGIRNQEINLNLKAGNYSVELYNLQGRLVSSVNIDAVSGINSTGLKTDKLSKGMFILNVKQGNSAVLLRKIMVK
jgi:beta-glucanase (GH16 family)